MQETESVSGVGGGAGGGEGETHRFQSMALSSCLAGIWFGRLCSLQLPRVLWFISLSTHAFLESRGLTEGAHWMVYMD